MGRWNGPAPSTNGFAADIGNPQCSHRLVPSRERHPVRFLGSEVKEGEDTLVQDSRCPPGGGDAHGAQGLPSGTSPDEELAPSVRLDPGARLLAAVPHHPTLFSPRSRSRRTSYPRRSARRTVGGSDSGRSPRTPSTSTRSRPSSALSDRSLSLGQTIGICDRSAERSRVR